MSVMSSAHASETRSPVPYSSSSSAASRRRSRPWRASSAADSVRCEVRPVSSGASTRRNASSTSSARGRRLRLLRAADRRARVAGEHAALDEEPAQRAHARQLARDRRRPVLAEQRRELAADVERRQACERHVLAALLREVLAQRVDIAQVDLDRARRVRTLDREVGGERGERLVPVHRPTIARPPAAARAIFAAQSAPAGGRTTTSSTEMLGPRDDRRSGSPRGPRAASSWRGRSRGDRPRSACRSRPRAARSRGCRTDAPRRRAPAPARAGPPSPRCSSHSR